MGHQAPFTDLNPIKSKDFRLRIGSSAAGDDFIGTKTKLACPKSGQGVGDRVCNEVGMGHAGELWR